MEQLFNNPDHSKDEGWVGIVYCLCIDMILSTEAALKRSIQEQNRFNNYLVRQITPHLKKLGLDKSIFQFTGDGWLVYTENANKLPALACFATIMANNFQEEMAAYTGFPKEQISPLRLAICPGLDMCVTLPDGSKHWVGDSARRAVRASGCCYINEVLIDDSVLNEISGDFYCMNIEVPDRQEESLCKKMEEALNLFTIEEFKPVIREDFEHPEWYIYTLTQLGRIKEAIDLTKASGSLLYKKMEELEYIPEKCLNKWNQLIINAPDYETALFLVALMEESNINYDVTTINSLIELSPDYNTAVEWFEKMIKNGIEGNLSTYNLLIEKTPECENGIVLLKEMDEKGIEADQKTFDCLILKSHDIDKTKFLLDEISKRKIPPNFEIFIHLLENTSDYEHAQFFLEDMEKKGIPANVVTYSLLVKKVTDYEEITRLMDELEKRGIPSDIVF